MGTVVLVGLGWVETGSARADCTLDHAVLRDRAVELTPPAVVRGGDLFVPLNFVTHGLGLSASPQPGGRQWQLDFFDKRAMFTVGQLHASGPGAADLLLPAAPFTEEKEVYVPAALLRTAFGLVLDAGPDSQGLPALRVHASGAHVADVRLGDHPDYDRVVVDLDAESVFDWQCTGDQVEIYLAPPAGSPLPERQVNIEGYHLQEVREISRTVSAEGFALIEVNLREDCVPVVSTISDPARIVIDIPLKGTACPAPSALLPPPSPPPPAAGRPGWTVRQFPMRLGMMNAYVLRLSQSDARWMLEPALASDTVHHRRTMLDMVRRLGGIAGINAGYFAWEGPPVGMVVIDGEWICTSIRPFVRTCLVVDKPGQVSMGRYQFEGKVYFAQHGYLHLTAINRSHDNGNELIMYTRRYGTTLEGCPLYTRLVVSEQGVMVQKETEGRAVEIPENGYVISGRSAYSELLQKVEVGEGVRLELGTKPALPDLWCLLEGGPRCVADGEECNYGDVERFQDDVRFGHCSRSGLGLTKNGDILLVAVETPGVGRGGLYLDEMSAIMKKLGAYQAMNWDGGGSTTVVQGDQIINRVACDPRPVSTGLIVVPRPTALASK